LKHKVLITSKSFARMSQAPLRILESNECEITRNPYGRLLDDATLSSLIQGCDALIVGDDEVGKETFGKADKLKVIAKHGVGIDNINVKLASERGITVTRALGSTTESVADLTFALMLALARNIVDAVNSTKQGMWEPVKYIGVEIHGKTLGIVGLGAIGKAVARRAKGFDMEILYYDISRDRDYEKRFGVKFADLDKLLRNSDIVTIHVPLTEATTHLIGARELKKMKTRAFLINTSRGRVVDEDALYRVVKNGSIAGAALDVYSKEPPGPDFRLLNLRNVVSTPHIGGYSEEANIAMGTITAEEVVKVLKGKKPEYALTKPGNSEIVVGHHSPT